MENQRDEEGRLIINNQKEFFDRCVDENKNIDARNVRLQFELNLSELELYKELGRVLFQNSIFENHVSFNGLMNVSGDADFSNATFSRDANFSRVVFLRNANFSKALFSNNANFEGILFLKDVNFEGATFSNNANFRAGLFKNITNFT